MAIRYYKSGGKRYYVIDVSGYPINPRAVGRVGGNRAPQSTYAVLDRDWMHREMGVFAPGPGVAERLCRERAYALAAELNAEEAAA